MPGFPRLVFIRVPEPKTVKNRIHLDLVAEDMKAEVRRVVELGGSVIEERSRWPDDVWTVLQDVEGNEICVEQLSAADG